MGTAFDDVMIAVTAAEMRKELGLQPWPLFEALARFARASYPDCHPDRRTGRSTRGSLAALAECRVRGLHAIHVAGDRVDVYRVKDLVQRLCLKVKVLDGAPDRYQGRSGGVLFYVDHYER